MALEMSVTLLQNRDNKLIAALLFQTLVSAQDLSLFNNNTVLDPLLAWPPILLDKPMPTGEGFGD